MSARVDDSEVQFKRMIITSLIFHGSIVLVFTIQTLVFPTENIEYQPAVRVDLVALPDKRKEPEVVEAPAPEKIEIPPETKPEPKKMEKPAKVDTAKSKADAFRKLKNMQAMDNLKKVKEAEAEKKAEPQTFKGNVISPGTALRGLDKLQYDEFIAAMQSHVYKNWNLPEWIKRLNLRAVAVVKIDKSGYVIEKVLVQPSGNTEFDRLVIETIGASSPLPAPPEKMQALVSIDGVKLGFPE